MSKNIKKQIKICSQDFNIPISEIIKYYDFLKNLSDKDFIMYTKDCLIYWDTHFIFYPINFCVFIKYAIYKNCNNIKLSFYSQKYLL